MNDNQSQAAARLLKKLTAVRVTLNNDERAILDRVVATASFDVEAHSMAGRPTEAATGAKIEAAKDVAIHAMTDKQIEAATGAKIEAAKDVEIHRMATEYDRMIGRRARYDAKADAYILIE